jgi:hypothetical protein
MQSQCVRAYLHIVHFACTRVHARARVLVTAPCECSNPARRSHSDELLDRIHVRRVQLDVIRQDHDCKLRARRTNCVQTWAKPRSARSFLSYLSLSVGTYRTSVQVWRLRVVVRRRDDLRADVRPDSRSAHRGAADELRAAAAVSRVLLHLPRADRRSAGGTRPSSPPPQPSASARHMRCCDAAPRSRARRTCAARKAATAGSP